MTNWIDRYIYDVTRRLPEDVRADVERELRANIADMLPEEGASEAEVFAVLESLGDPAKLAEQYRPHPRHLIPPSMLDDYFAVLKTVIPIASLGMAALTLVIGFAGISDPLNPGAVADAVAETIATLFDAAANVFLWTTVGFALAGHFGRKRSEAKVWTPGNLPKLPSPTSVRIPRGSTVTGMAFCVLFTALMVVVFTRYPNLLAIYHVSDGRMEVTPVFSAAGLLRYVPAFIAVSACSLLVSAAKLYWGRWNYPVAVLNAVYCVGSAAAGIAFLMQNGLPDPAFLSRAAALTAVDIGVVGTWWSRGAVILVFIISCISTFDAIMGFNKAYKADQTRK